MKVVAAYRRARYDYDILESLEAGIMLTGPEVKSCRAGHISLAGSYVLLKNGRAIVRNIAISPYQYTAHSDGYDPAHDRELLLKREEFTRLQTGIDQKGLTLIPLEVRAGKYIKVLIGLCRGKKQFDKRASIKKRDTERRIREGREV